MACLSTCVRGFLAVFVVGIVLLGCGDEIVGSGETGSVNSKKASLDRAVCASWSNNYYLANCTSYGARELKAICAGAPGFACTDSGCQLHPNCMYYEIVWATITGQCLNPETLQCTCTCNWTIGK